MGDGVQEREGCQRMTNLRLLYEQGSECCRNYSQQTMRVRTLAQQVMLAYVVGVGLILAKGSDGEALVLFIAGIVLILFSTVLWVLNQHYSLAFTRIRDESLAPIEKVLLEPEKLQGPWTSHATGQPDWLRVASWHWPYVVLVLVGLLTMIVGVAK